MAPRPDLTGFDPQKFARSAGTPENDPWRRYEAWRYEGPFTRRNRFKHLFPGFKTAVVAFAVYLVYEKYFIKDKHGHSEITDGKDHHTHAT